MSVPTTSTKMDQAPLEERLRSMILSNVTMSDPQTQPESSRRGQRHHHHQRYSGRGFRSRGAHSNPRGQTTQGFGHSSASPTNFRGDRGSNLPMRGDREQQDHSSTHVQPATPGSVATGHRAQNAPISHNSKRHNFGSHQTQQFHQQNQARGARDAVHEHPDLSANPRVLQRSQEHANPSANSQGSPVIQYSTRQPRFPVHQQSTYLNSENSMVQVDYLDHLASQEIPKVEITMTELEEKEVFRKHLESICRDAVAKDCSGNLATIDLVGFGSLASGFATPGSDMDLAIVPQWNHTSDIEDIKINRDIPRVLERAILDNKMGGRLLTRTRVPILKVCQEPTDELFGALFEERRNWDELPDVEKYPPPPPEPHPAMLMKAAEIPSEEQKQREHANVERASSNTEATKKTFDTLIDDAQMSTRTHEANSTVKVPNHQKEKVWLREKMLGPLDFPKSGVGIQCDINFENPLAIHNTHLLRCYSLCDPRVRPMVLFVKSWAKRRKINSSYSGTLSSYGWVLMVLHYLINVASPPVCPNLQLSWRPPTDLQGLEAMYKATVVCGYAVRFWRNEKEIVHAARSNLLTRNSQSVGALLRGFFHYYAAPSTGFIRGPRPPSFWWTKEVLSLRTLGGIRMKEEKGWTGAKTTHVAGKEVRHRYLFAIEDPFELDHNVARTVTHNGIVAIRDEFRRAWSIISAVGRNVEPDEGLFDDVVETVPPPSLAKIDVEEVSMDSVMIHDAHNEARA